MNLDGSVTTWIGLLQAGENDAAQQLWERYFPRLIELAHSKMAGLPKQDADEEDMALSAFHSFCQAAAGKRIPNVNNRDDLWRTLALITAGKVVERRRYLGRQKRGGTSAGSGRPARGADCDPEILEQIVGTEPDPEFAVEIAEQFDRLLDRLMDDELRRTALLKLEGYTNDEIAERLACSPRTVTRRLTVIRRTWEAAVDE